MNNPFTFQCKQFQNLETVVPSTLNNILIPVFDTKQEDVNLILPFNKSVVIKQDNKIQAQFNLQFWRVFGLIILGTAMLGAILVTMRLGIYVGDVVGHALHHVLH